METFTFNPLPTHQSSVPTENFSLNFEEIKVTYRNEKHDKWIDVLSVGW